LVDREGLNKPWQFALNEIADLDREKANQNAPANEVLQLRAKISHAKNQRHVIGTVVLPPYPEFLELARAHEGETDVIQFQFEAILPRPMSNERYRDRLLAIQSDFFSPKSSLPDDPNDRDEYVFAKHRLERKVSSVTPNPNSVSAVLEKYCRFSSIRPETRSKYRTSWQSVLTKQAR
jgi:hypothetical protein